VNYGNAAVQQKPIRLVYQILAKNMCEYFIPKTGFFQIWNFLHTAGSIYCMKRVTDLFLWVSHITIGVLLDQDVDSDEYSEDRRWQ